MSNATDIFELFKSQKNHSRNRQTRQRYHNVQDPWKDTYTDSIFNDLNIFITSKDWKKQQMSYCWSPFGWKGVGRKGTEREDIRNLYMKGPKNTIIDPFPPSEGEDKEAAWQGFYVSPDRNVARGYLETNKSVLFRIYVREDGWNCVYKLEEGQTMKGENARDIMIKAHKQKPKFFSLTGPQDDENPEPETIIIGSNVKEKLLAVPVPIVFNDRNYNYNGQNRAINKTINSNQSFPSECK